MKKIIVFIYLAILATNLSAQFVVDSLGRVGIGTETPQSLIAFGTEGDDVIAIDCEASDNIYGLLLRNYSDIGMSIAGGYFNVKNNITSSVGCRGTAFGNRHSTASQTAIGLEGLATHSTTSIGIFGGKFLGSYTPTNFAGVYGSETEMSPSFYNYSGLYAGYFNGKVRVTNGIYATVLSPTASASSNGQNEATILSDRGESVTDKLSKVQAVQFLRYDPTEEVGTRRNASVPSDEEIDKMSPLQLDSLAATLEAEEPERYLSTIQYGLDVDQLKAVYPELVYEDANGNVSINYVEMVPLLVQSINELKKELAEMKGTSAKKAKAETTGIDKTVSDIDMVRMDQNKPNPFSESTVIALNIPQEAQTANIYIYDMSGKQVQSLSVSERGETNITVYASDITPGMYIYTLVVDGKVAVTRRMIVSEI